MAPKPSLQERIRRGDTLLNQFLMIPSPSIVEMVGEAGFDYVIIDGEHGPFSRFEMEMMIRAADAVGVHSVVRVPQREANIVGAVLDWGASGVQVPHVSTVQEAKIVIEGARFSPGGERGLCPPIRGSHYFKEPPSEWCPRCNREQAVILQIEGKEGIENLESILDVEGINAIFLGPYDLSQSLATPGDIKNPKVIQAMEHAVQLGKKKGIAVATFCHGAEDAKFWHGKGVRLISVATDIITIMQATLALRQSIKL